MAPQRIDHPQKSPRTEMTSAAGKCLRKMDLPLARCEPSPPYRLREALRPAGRCPIALPKPYPDCPLRVEATRARFEFVGRTHREKTHSWGSVKLPVHLYHGQPEQLHCRLAAAAAVISRGCSKVKQRMTLRVIILNFSFAAALSWLGRSCL
jgi:hypothetical protein